MNTISLITVRGHSVREDEFGLWNLNDIWSLAKAPITKLPKHWRSSAFAKKLIPELQKKVTNSYLKANKQNIPVIYAKSGRGNDGTYAHPILAAAYAGYLSPKLEIETREVWLRYRAGDATLADEVLQRASPEANEWAAKRAMGRAVRGLYTNELDKRGVVKPVHYAICTNTTYQGLTGKTAAELRAERNVMGPLRDAMTISEIAFIAASEALSVERMEYEDSAGFDQCRTATAKAASAIRNAIEADRRDRVKVPS
ncbi:KilA-N domain-containing protein [Rhizobium sp. TH2]|uniref:KilA-N domain-containing protein n=1 Tax=Rhizobium sp. TH2 TaxID=2775403 RepID=UPI0021580DBA|nr:KilA-N domain-containing protein [Rhizobium sp. TH2]UVC08360.1 KilA-N domain-containing protein [Rhizobium sp. TH2]